MPPVANSTWLKRSPLRSTPLNSARIEGARAAFGDDPLGNDVGERLVDDAGEQVAGELPRADRRRETAG